jgi:hypothetical protein
MSPLSFIASGSPYGQFKAALSFGKRWRCSKLLASCPWPSSEKKGRTSIQQFLRYSTFLEKAELENATRFQDS